MNNTTQPAAAAAAKLLAWLTVAGLAVVLALAIVATVFGG